MSKFGDPDFDASDELYRRTRVLTDDNEGDAVDYYRKHIFPVASEFMEYEESSPIDDVFYATVDRVGEAAVRRAGKILGIDPFLFTRVIDVREDFCNGESSEDITLEKLIQLRDYQKVTIKADRHFDIDACREFLSENAKDNFFVYEMGHAVNFEVWGYFADNIDATLFLMKFS